VSKAVVFETAAIVGVKHKISNAAVLNMIEFVATYDPKTAVQLGQSKFLVYDQENVPKTGFKTVELELEMHALKVAAGATPQIKKVCSEVIDWATPFVENVSPEVTEEELSVAE
jgi:hypothetical protein